MVVFSRWATTIPGATGALDATARDREANVVREVGNESASLADFLKDRQLMPADDIATAEQGRARIEESGLLAMMLETCGSLNSLAGRTLVDVHSFLPPNPTLCCFVFVESGTEYLMGLELRDTTPTLVFVERKWRDTVTNDFVRWALRLVDIEPVTINIKSIHELQDLRASSQQVRKWFMYLVSGMEHSHLPLF